MKIEANLKGTRDCGFYCENLLTPVYVHCDRHLGDRLLSPGRSQLEAAAARIYPRCFNARFTNRIGYFFFFAAVAERSGLGNETTRRSVASRFGRSTAYPRDRNREDTISGCVAGHLRALLTQDFLSQLRARSRDGGGAVTGHVGHVGHYGHKCQLLFSVGKRPHKIRDKPFL